MRYNKKIFKTLLLNFIKLASQFYFSKLFLIIFLFFSNINSGNSQVCFDRSCPSSSRQTLANTPTPLDPTIFNPENSVYDSSTNIHKITFKNSSLNIFIYTNYLAPADSINPIAPKHTLNKCQNSAPLSDVGEVCMYDIAPQCVAGLAAGINCINYTNSFIDKANKKLKPIECQTGMTHGLNCMDIRKLKYCQEVEVPILGLNCKLPACSFIPNNLFRRPGVNCLANCLDNPGKQIFQNENFIEGVNCLTPCSTGLDGSCVLKFLKNVIPFCNKEGNAHYNVATTSYDIRSQCMDIKDAEICNGSNVIGFGDNTCFPKCLTETDENCINNNSRLTVQNIPLSKKCHHLTTTEPCEKISCSKLTPNELGLYKNTINYLETTNQNFLKSDQKYCLTAPYNQFTYEQLNSSEYLNHYTLINKPCSGYDGTTFEMSILSSSYYYTTSALTVPNMVDIVNAQCTSKLSTACSSNQKNNPESTYVYSASSYCKGSDMVEAISCQNFINNRNKPYDCNSTTPSPKTDCSHVADATSGLVACCPTGATNCYKTNINCNLSSNSDYQVCKATAQAQQFTEPEDKEMSWFFRPAISSDAIESYVDGGQTKYRNYKVSGDAFSLTPS